MWVWTIVDIWKIDAQEIASMLKARRMFYVSSCQNSLLSWKCQLYRCKESRINSQICQGWHRFILYFLVLQCSFKPTDRLLVCVTRAGTIQNMSCRTICRPSSFARLWSLSVGRSMGYISLTSSYEFYCNQFRCAEPSHSCDAISQNTIQALARMTIWRPIWAKHRKSVGSVGLVAVRNQHNWANGDNAKRIAIHTGHVSGTCKLSMAIGMMLGS